MAGGRRQVAGGSAVATAPRGSKPVVQSCVETNWRVSNSEWVVGGRWQVAGGRWQVAGGRWQVAGNRWQVTGGRVQVACVHIIRRIGLLLPALQCSTVQCSVVKLGY